MKVSRPPRKSSVRRAALVIRSLKDWPSTSDWSVAGDRAGRKRRLVLMFEWLTLCPTIGPTPVSSQRRDMKATFAKERRTREGGLRTGAGGIGKSGQGVKDWSWRRLPFSRREEVGGGERRGRGYGGKGGA